ncbi:hydroxyethylthiazole kinase [Leuconostoc suionicum]|uniref:hydroxyethylthiazole kinase n=1 Tax=Leuconostoc suionicum TaxID=1511761 RepID=UPI0032DEC027
MKNELIKIKSILPLQKAPLVHCITNDITLETVANTILYLGGKPIMSSDTREFASLFQSTDALLLNMGRLNESHEQSLSQASSLADVTKKPTVVDLVGYGITNERTKLGMAMARNHPTVIKGNTSEIRRFIGLPSLAKGIDGASSDQHDQALKDLIFSLKQITADYADTVFVATGKKDVIVQNDKHLILNNGVDELDKFVGTGDIVGAIITTLLGIGKDPWVASQFAISYLNIAAEKALLLTNGMENFRREVLNQIDLLCNDPRWVVNIKYS